MAQECLENCTQTSNVRNPGRLAYTDDFTTYFYGDYNPIGSMYGIFPKIWLKCVVNVGLNIPFMDPMGINHDMDPH